MPRAKKPSAGEAAVQELQDKPAEVARAEAEHTADALSKKRGRPIGSKNNVRRGGRPKGSKNKPKPAAKRLDRPLGSKNKPKVGRPEVTIRRGPGRPSKNTVGSGLGQINAVVDSMVEQRTREVLRNALVALKQAVKSVEAAL